MISERYVYSIQSIWKTNELFNGTWNYYFFCKHYIELHAKPSAATINQNRFFRPKYTIITNTDCANRDVNVAASRGRILDIIFGEKRKLFAVSNHSKSRLSY